MSFAPLSPGRQDSPPDRLRTKTLARALRDRTQRLEPMRKAQVKALVLHLERCRSPSTPASGCWLAFKIFAAQARAPRSMAGVIDSTRLARPRSRVVQRPRREGEQAAAGRVLFELNSELAFAAQDRQAGRQAGRQTDRRPASSTRVQPGSILFAPRQTSFACNAKAHHPSVSLCGRSHASPIRSMALSLSLSLSPACDITSEVRAQSSVVEMCRGHDAVEWKLGSDAGPGQQQCLVGAAGSTLGWCRIFGISRPLAWHGLGFDC